jgi:hypothetical protein
VEPPQPEPGGEDGAAQAPGAGKPGVDTGIRDAVQCRRAQETRSMGGDANSVADVRRNGTGAKREALDVSNRGCKASSCGAGIGFRRPALRSASCGPVVCFNGCGMVDFRNRARELTGVEHPSMAMLHGR